MTTTPTTPETSDLGWMLAYAWRAEMDAAADAALWRQAELLASCEFYRLAFAAAEGDSLARDAAAAQIGLVLLVRRQLREAHEVSARCRRIRIGLDDRIRLDDESAAAAHVGSEGAGDVLCLS